MPEYREVWCNQATLKTTAERIADIPVGRAHLQIESQNSGVVTVGDADHQYIVVGLTGLDVFPANLNQLYAKSTVDGDKLNWIVFQART